MESPANYPDSPIDQDDAVHPCKGCGEILEEGKAFELAGNRWHIDCFRCNQCKTLLDSDANLLLLGDGSLICNNCTYSCSACGSKIEDLAILTGDQAFCASCFKCRNCKKKIENLRYARTSQGIFCMNCHETLMARRRKKSKANRANSNSVSVVLDKSLPALPPVFSAATPGVDTPPELISELPAESPPETQPARHQNPALGAADPRDAPSTDHNDKKESLTLPASTYNSNRHSFVGQNLDGQGQSGDDGFYISLALDPDTAPGPSPMAKENGTQDKGHRGSDGEKQIRGSTGNSARAPVPSSHRAPLKENGQSSSRSSSTERLMRRGPASPHIAYQQKPRQGTSHEHSESRTRNGLDSSPALERNVQSQASSTYTSQANSPADFKLQEVPRPRKESLSRKLSQSKSQSPGAPATLEQSSGGVPANLNDQYKHVRQVDRPARGSSLERPARGDSLNQVLGQQNITRKEIATTGPSMPPHQRSVSSASIPKSGNDTSLYSSRHNGSTSVASPDTFDTPNLPIRSTSRPNVGRPGQESFAPSRPGLPATSERHKTSDSIMSVTSNASGQISPPLPRGNTGDNFTMDDEMSRILKGEQLDDGNSVLHQASNAVKHMRSMSDRSGTTPRGSRSARTPSMTTPGGDLQSPTAGSPGASEETVQLRNKLRRAQHQIVELEAEKRKLEDIIDNSGSMSRIDSELSAKRHTLSGLDTDRELIVRELEVMTEHLRRAKESNRPIDTNELKGEITRDFIASLKKLRDDVRKDIEELIHTRNELTIEIGEIIQMKDRGNQEYESLTNRIAQLQQVHGQLTRDIQRTFEHQRGGPGPMRQPLNVATPLAESRSTTSSGIASPSGLGIYAPSQSKESTALSSTDTMRANSNDPSTQTLVSDDAEPAVVTAPHVISIRKPRGNVWKKGSQAVAKNLKGIKGAFVAAQYADRNSPYGNQGSSVTEGIPYGSMPASGESHPVISGPMNVKRGDGMQNFWAGGQRNATGRVPGRMTPTTPNAGNGTSTSTVHAEDAIYGSDLSERVRFEGSQIPNIVARCIQEVESRGMDVEGIYRKSGGSGQINAVKAGFEKDPNYDISDPDMDIHAVTSALKQYFRRLPIPLIPHHSYQTFLEVADIEVQPGDAQAQERRIQALIAVLKAMPQAHRDVLIFLNFHLQRVMQQEPLNRMTSLNLSVVFAPTILCCPDPAQELLDMGKQRSAVQALLDDHTRIADVIEEWERAGQPI